MNQDLINRINDAISKLQQQKAQLESLGKSTAGVENSMKVLNSILADQANNAGNVANKLALVTQRLNEYFSAVEKNKSKRMDLAGYGRVDTGTLVGAEATHAGQSLASAVSNPNSPINSPDSNSKASVANLQGPVFSEKQKKLDAESKKLQQQQERIQQLKKESQDREEKRLQGLQNLGTTLPGGQQAADRLFARAQKIDPAFTPDKIKSVSTEPTTGITKVNYEMQTSEGIFKRATFTVDRFGNVLSDTQKRFRSFGDAISRDVVEFAKWTIAASIILVPLQKLGELTQVMIKNQSSLADVTISLGNAQKSTNAVFQESYDIAKKTGESVDGVIEAYNQAYRATGGTAEGQERFAASNQLLTDSITLSKLSTLDQKEAIDLLSASLKQTGKPLTDGAELINKWVAVSRVANVDLTTLATGFATLGDAAESSGLSLDDLNTIIALIAESTGQSAQEVANTARALVAGIQQDAGQAELLRNGVDVIDQATGKAKNFLEILTEINDLRSKGIIDEEAFKSLTNVLGGGVKRGNAVSGFINQFANTDKVNKIMEASEGAKLNTGEAQDALAAKLETVETSVTNLGNAFQGLAQTLGTKGGLLDSFTNFLNAGTAIVEMLNSLVNVLGKAAPALATSALLLGVINNYQGGKFANSLNVGTKSLGSNLALKLSDNKYLNSPQYNQNGFEYGPAYSTRANFANKFSSGFNTAAKYGGAIGMGALPAVSTLLSEGLTKDSMTKAGVTLGGSVVGALATGGNPVGAMIGGTIASAFAEKVIGYKVDFNDLFPNLKSEEEVKNTSNKSKTVDERFSDLFKEITEKTGSEFALGASSFFTGKSPAVILEEQLKDGSLGRTSSGRSSLSAEDRQRFLSELDKLKEEKTRTVVTPDKRAFDTANAYQTDIDKASNSEKARLLSLLMKKDIGVAPYRQGIESLDKNFKATSSQFYSSFGEKQDPGDFFGKMARISGEGKPEQIDQLTLYKEKINAISAEMLTLTKNTESYKSKEQEKTQIVSSAIDYMNELNQSILANVSLLNDVDLSEFTASEIDQIVEMARKMQEELLKAQVAAGEISLAQMEAFVAQLDKILIKSKDKGYLVEDNVSADYINAAKSKFAEDNKDKIKGLGFQAYEDYTKPEFESAISGYDDLKKQLEGLGYKSDEESQINIYKEGIIAPMTKDWKIVQYLLQQIEKNTSKLDGAYNLPEGSSFWVPYQASKLKGEGSDYPETSKNTLAEAAKKEAMKATSSYPETSKNTGEDSSYYTSRSKPKLPALSSLASGFGLGASPGKSPLIEVTKSLAPKLFTSFTDVVKDFMKPNATAQGKGDISSMLTNMVGNLSTNLKLTVENKTVIMLDGRQLATAMKTYYKDDLVRYSASSASKVVNLI